MSMNSFNRGRSTGEREGVPAYGNPDEVRRVSGGGVAGLLPPDSGNRRAPIRGNARMERIPGTHGSQPVAGTGVVLSPTDRQVQGAVALRMAENISMPQYNHAVWVVERGMPGKADAPDGTPRTSGRIKAVQAYGLGNAYARPGPSGHSPNAP